MARLKNEDVLDDKHVPAKWRTISAEEECEACVGADCQLCDGTGKIHVLGAFCEPFVRKLAEIVGAEVSSLPRGYGALPDRLRAARAAIEDAARVSPTPWLTVPREGPIKLSEEAGDELLTLREAGKRLDWLSLAPKSVVVAGDLLAALDEWADRLASQAADVRETDQLTPLQRRSIRALQRQFRWKWYGFAMARTGAKGTPDPHDGLGSELYRHVFQDERNTPAGFQRARERDAEKRPHLYRYALAEKGIGAALRRGPAPSAETLQIAFGDSDEVSEPTTTNS